MLTLCGITASNYHNKVKLALLEKGVPFNEEKVPLREKTPAMLAASPLGKVPYLLTEHGPLCESQPVLEYIEELHPTPALLPADPYARAKVRELITFIDLHVELTARELYGKAFFGGEISESHAARVRKLLVKNIAGLKQIAKFSPYIAGDTFTMADCAAWASLPVVAMATKIIYGADLLAEGGIDWKTYTRFIGERPSAQRVTAERKADEATAKAKS